MEHCLGGTSCSSIRSVVASMRRARWMSSSVYEDVQQHAQILSHVRMAASDSVAISTPDMGSVGASSTRTLI